jgi:hypothetical protein
VTTRVDEIVKQLDALLLRHGGFLQWQEPPARMVVGLLTSAQAAIERLSPPDSPYRAQCWATLQEGNAEAYKLDRLMGVVEALRDDYKAGALAPIQSLVRAEVFDDFLDMAGHLLDEGYKDPAAVLIGGVLEQHLRRLCLKAAVAIEKDGAPRKVDALNADLAGKGSYGKLDQKSVTSWLDLRNKAAHGEYDAYTAEQVRIMVMGVRDFIGRSRA